MMDYGVDFKEFKKVMEEYKKRFGGYDWGDEECLPEPDFLLPVMKYCLKHNKSYSELTAEEVNKILGVEEE